MKIKVEDVKPELPPDTLRKINNWIHWNIYPCAMKGLNMCMMHKSIGITRQCGGGNHYLDCKIPLYCTSIDAALMLCERIDVCISIERNTRGKYLVAVCGKKYKDDPCEIYNLSFNQLRCAAIHALLRSQNVTEVEI